MKAAQFFKTTIYGLALAALALPASAQMRVDSRLHVSSGSCAACDLSNKTMTRMKLKDANFAGSNFSRSNLSGGKFDGSNLSGAHFTKAYLVRVEGGLVDLSNAVFADATMTEASLSDSNFTKTNMRRADMTRGTFERNNFNEADFTSATAPDTKFNGSHFIGANLDHINLRNAKLDGGIFREAKFGDAILLDATMAGADLSNADMSQAQGLSQAQLDTACGNANTRLPAGLSVPYCESELMAEYAHDPVAHKSLNPKMAKAAKNLDEAIKDLEKLMQKTSDKSTRRALQNIHSDLIASRQYIER